jgi:hypothetical protein
MRNDLPPDWTNDDLFDALGAFVMAMASQMPPDQVDRISADLLLTAAGMANEGRDAAATLTSALANALYLPQRDEHPDPH